MARFIPMATAFASRTKAAGSGSGRPLTLTRCRTRGMMGLTWTATWMHQRRPRRHRISPRFPLLLCAKQPMTTAQVCALHTLCVCVVVHAICRMFTRRPRFPPSRLVVCWWPPRVVRCSCSNQRGQWHGWCMQPTRLGVTMALLLRRLPFHLCVKHLNRPCTQ